jgi:hypothetical protein
MVPQTLSTPQFRPERAEEEIEPAPADHSAEAMARLRHPFDLASVPAGGGEDFSRIQV